jgi:excisionase family DNA binding protein
MRLLTLPQFAEMLSLKLSTVRSWIWTKRIPYVKVGRSVRIRQDVAEGLVERGTVLPVSVGDPDEPGGPTRGESSGSNRAR